MQRRQAGLVLAVTLAAATWAEQARAEEGLRPETSPERDPVAGEALFLEGRRLMKEGDLRAACDRFAESERLDPAVGTLANLADCQEQIGRSASAWQSWRQAVARMRSGDPRRTTASARASVLERKLARLSINLPPGSPVEAVVWHNRVRLEQSSYGLLLPVDPGLHVVEVALAGHAVERRTVVIAPEEKWELVLPAGRPLAAGESGPTAIVPPPLPVALTTSSVIPAAAGLDGALVGQLPAAPARSRWLGWGLVGAGGAALATGAVLGWQALRMREYAGDRCSVSARGDAPGCWATARRALELDRQYSVGADVAFITGAVAAGTGAFLLLRQRRSSARAPRKRDGQSGAVGATVLASPRRGGGEVQVVGQF